MRNYVYQRVKAVGRLRTTELVRKLSQLRAYLAIMRTSAQSPEPTLKTNIWPAWRCACNPSTEDVGLQRKLIAAHWGSLAGQPRLHAELWASAGS